MHEPVDTQTIARYSAGEFVVVSFVIGGERVLVRGEAREGIALAYDDDMLVGLAQFVRQARADAAAIDHQHPGERSGGGDGVLFVFGAPQPPKRRVEPVFLVRATSIGGCRRERAPLGSFYPEPAAFEWISRQRHALSARIGVIAGPIDRDAPQP